MKSLLSNLFSASLIILTFSISTTAQQPDSSQQKSIPLQKGSWSIQFGYNNNLGFRSFKGGNISAKYHFTSNSALRFGVNITLGNNKQKEINSIQPNDQKYFQDKTNNMINIGLLTDYVYYLTTNNRVNLFLSAGTNFGVGYSKLNSKRSSGVMDSVSTIGSGKTNSWFAGVKVSLGVEWFVTSNFSLHGEYITKFQYQYSKYNSTVTDFGAYSRVMHNENVIKYYKFSPDNVLIGVSLYF